jgi:hydroxyacylglutathione hydrolase
MMRIHTFSGGDFGENGYLAICEVSGSGIAIDPGAASPSMVLKLLEEDIPLDAIVLTHAHLDHVEGVPTLRDHAPEVPIYLHDADRPLYSAVDLQARAFNLPEIGRLPDPTHTLEAGVNFEFGRCRFDVRHAPGHAPGHVILYSEADGVAFVGDVIFQGAIGRADLPGGDYHQLMDSIRREVLSLPDDVRLLNGHGPETTVGWERRTNPFIIGHFGGDRA